MRQRHPGHRLRRRGFLRTSALAGLSLGLAPGLAPAKAPPRIRRYVRLGRTDLQVSDIGFGASALRGDPDLVRYALARGINYFDTAEGYGRGKSESTLGSALGKQREDVVLVSKTSAPADATRDTLMKRLEDSLTRLQTDRIDIFLNHAVNDVARLQNPEWWEFAALARAQGKIRYTGMSGHGGRLAECLAWGLEQDLLDVILVAYNFGSDPGLLERFTRGLDFVATQPELPELLARARQRDVGVVAMKTLLGGRRNDLAPYETSDSTFAQAAFRWVLSNPDTDNLIVTMKTRATIDEYVAASGAKALEPRDEALLGRYLARNHETQCRYGCSACNGVCPVGVDIPNVLRTRMYDVDYQERESARLDYAALSGDAAPCAGCSGAPCASACSYGLDIHALAAEAHRRLS